MMPDVYAALFLLAVASAPAIWAVVRIARTSYTPLQAVFCFVAYLFVRILWRARLPARLPDLPTAGAVFVCNHRSSIDPFFIQVLADRPIHWMVAREFCESLAFGWLLRQCEVIPVNRGGIDTMATKQAIRYVAGGEWVGMLPEGRINLTDELLLPARPGAALVALKGKAAISPCYIEGAPYAGVPWSPFLMPARVCLRFGQPIDLSQASGITGEDGAARSATIDCLKAIAALAGRTDFEPRLAGRSWKPSPAELHADMAASARRNAV